MLAVGPLGPQYCWLFAWYELGRHAYLGHKKVMNRNIRINILFNLNTLILSNYNYSIFLKNVLHVTTGRPVRRLWIGMLNIILLYYITRKHIDMSCKLRSARLFTYNYSPKLLFMSEIFMANAPVQPLPNRDIYAYY